MNRAIISGVNTRAAECATYLLHKGCAFGLPFTRCRHASTLAYNSLALMPYMEQRMGNCLQAKQLFTKASEIFTQIGASTDFSDQKRALQELQKFTKMRNQLGGLTQLLGGPW